jgi:hypothetical protein
MTYHVLVYISYVKNVTNLRNRMQKGHFIYPHLHCTCNALFSGTATAKTATHRKLPGNS